MASKKVRNCQICKTSFKGRRDAKTCSPACRKRLERSLKAQAVSVATRLESELGKEFHRLAASLMAEHVIQEPLVLADETGSIPAPGIAPQPLGPTVPSSPIKPVIQSTLPTPPSIEPDDLMSTESLDAPSAEPQPTPSAGNEKPLTALRPKLFAFHYNKLAFMITSLAVLVIAAIAGTSVYLGAKHSQADKSAVSQTGSSKVTNLSLGNIDTNPTLRFGDARQLTINGQLKVSDSLVLSPTTTPVSPIEGQIYFDQTAKAPFYYNGSKFVSLGSQKGGVTSLGGTSGAIGLGNGLSVVNNQLDVSGAIQQEIIQAAAGGVQTLAGTANQINVSSSTGNVTLSLPQNIATNSSPTFAGLRVSGLGVGVVQSNSLGQLSSGIINRNDANYLSGTLSIANGGTGATTFTSNGVLYGNGTNQLQATASAVDSVLITSAAGVPGLSQTLPVTVQKNITHTGELIEGSIALGFGEISTGNIISTTQLVQAGSLRVDGGSFTVSDTGNFVAAGTGAIQGAGGLTIGVPGPSGTDGFLYLANSSSSREVVIQGLDPSGSGNATVQIPSIPGSSTDEFCLKAASNCVGSSGGAIGGGGTANTIPIFTGTGFTIGNSTLSQSGTTLTASGNVVIQGTNSLALGTAGPSGNLGAIRFYDGSDSNVLTLQAGSTASNLTLTLPAQDGPVGETSCLQTNGSGILSFNHCTGGGAGGVNTLNGMTDDITLQGTANQVSVTNNAGLHTITLSLPQSINNTATPTFGGLILQGTSTSSALSVTQSGSNNPGANQALILANNNSSVPSGNLLDLQALGVSKLHVNVSGDLTTVGNITTTAGGLTTAGTVTFNNTTSSGASATPLCIESSILRTCSAGAGSGSFILNSASGPQTANFNIQSAAAGSVVAAIQGASGQTADLLQIKNSSGKVAGFDANGKLQFADGTGAAYDAGLFRSAAGTLSVQASSSGTATLQAAANSGTDISGNNLNLAGGTGTGAGVGGNLNFQIAPSSSAPNPTYGTVTGNPNYIATDDSNLYWTTTTGNVMKANLDGSSPTTLVTSANTNNPQGIVVSGSTLYWVNRGSGTIGKVGTNGSGITQNYVSGINATYAVTVYSGIIYWTNSGNTVGKANASDGTVITTNFASINTGLSQGIAVNSSGIYWSVFGSSGGGSSIGHANLDGTSSTQTFITTGPSATSPNGVAVDNAYVYWANTKTGVGTLGRAKLDGSSVTQSFVSLGSSYRPAGVALNSSFLYWNYASGTNIGRYQLGGTTPGTAVTVASLAGANGAALFQNAANSTTAFQIQNAAGTNMLTVDTNNSQLAVGPAAVPANGVLTIGTNTTASTGGLYFGDDTNLYRSGSAVLATNSSLQLQGSTTTTGALNLATGTTASSGIAFGTSANLYTSAASFLTTNASLQVQGSTTTAGAINLPTGTTASSGIAFGPNTALFRSATGVLNIQGSSSVTLQVAAVSGGDVNGNDFNLSGGAGTGAGYGGNLNFQITPLTASINQNFISASNPRGVVAYGNYIYWANSNKTIGRADISSGSPTGITQNYASGLAQAPEGIATDGTYIYWADGATHIGRALLGATNASGINDTFISGVGGGVQGLAIDSTGTYIYWSNYGGTTIGRALISTPAGANNSFITIGSGSHGVAVDSTSVYWARSNMIGYALISTPGTTNTLVNSTYVSNGTGVMVDSNHVYWGNNTTDSIGRASISGGSPNQYFITGAAGSSPWDIAIDSAHLYWANNGSNNIGRMVLNSTTVNGPTTVANLSGVDGGALFKNAINTTTAFQVQNLAGNNYIQVDTLNANLYLGNAIANTIQIGNTTGATGLTERVGTGNYSLDGVAGSTYAFGASTTTGTITIGGTAQTGSITLGSSSGTNSVLIGDGAGATTVNISNSNTAGAVNIGSAFTTGTISIGGTGLQTGTINLGTGTGAQSINLATGGTGAKTVRVGSTASSSSTTIRSGTGNLSLQTQGTGTLGVGNNAVAQNIAIGNGTGGTTVSVDCGTGNCNFGTTGTDHTTTVGSTNGTSNTTIQSGSGSISLNSATIATNASTLALFNSTPTTINFGGNVGSGGINFAGGSGSSGCTIAGDTGNLTCSGAISTIATTGTQGWLSRSGALLQPVNTGDSIRVSNAGGELLTLQSDAGGTYLDSQSSSSSDWLVTGKVLADANQRYILKTSGEMQWGNGTNAPDIILTRSGAGALSLQPTTGNNSTSAFSIKNDSGATLLNFDNSLASGRLAIGGAGTGSEKLELFRQDTTTANGINFTTHTGTDWTIAQATGSNDLSFWNDNLGANTVIFSSGGNVTLGAGVTGGTLTADIAGTATSNAVCHSGGSGAAEDVQIVACTGSIVADYAEKYPVAIGISYGDIVATGTNMVNTYGTNTDGNADWNSVNGHLTQLVKADNPYQANTIGIVSNNYNNFTSAGNNIKPENNPMPVALNGRVPVNVSPGSEPIQSGDYLTTSGDSGKAMKANGAGFVIGKALEAWDPSSGATQVMVFVEPSYYPGPSNADYLQNGGDATLNNLTLTGSLAAQNLNVNGNTSTNTLNVSGDTTLQGNLTISGTTEMQGNLNANQDLNVTGKTGLNNDLTVTGETNLQGGLKASGSSQLQQITANSIVLTGSASVNELTANIATIDQITSPSASITNLDVNGTATIATLHITGDSIFDGKVTISSALITQGSQPTIDYLDAAWKDNDSNTQEQNQAQVTIEGNDTAGTITLKTGDNPVAGELLKVIFASPYSTPPKVIFSPDNDTAAGLQVFRSDITGEYFILKSRNAPSPNTTYTYDYFIVQAK